MRYSQIKKYDVANGLGVRTSLFVTGCTHKCFNCFNKELQSFNSGELWTDTETKLIIDHLSDNHVAGLSILGGEPMQNAEGLISMIREVKQHTDKNIWLWSGYEYEDIISDKQRLNLLREVDVLIEGKFIDRLKDITLKFRGSSNQRVIDVKKSLDSGKIILFENE